MCSHPMMIESAARYGSASSNIRVTPTRLMSASTVTAISRRNTNTSVLYQTFRNESRMTSSPTQNRTCSLPEIPISPSQRSVVSCDSPLLVQTKRIAEKQCGATFDGTCPYQLSRDSTFPNFRALQTLGLTTKTRTLDLTKNSKMKSSPTTHTLSNGTVPLPLPVLSSENDQILPVLSSENDQIRNCEQDLRCNRSIEDVHAPTGFSTLASLPGNRYGDTDEGQRYARSDEMIHAYVAGKLGPQKSIWSLVIGSRIGAVFCFLVIFFLLNFFAKTWNTLKQNRISHCSKSPRISFPLLTWLHFPLLKCILRHLLKANLWNLSYLDRKVP